MKKKVNFSLYSSYNFTSNQNLFPKIDEKVKLGELKIDQKYFVK